MLNLMINCVMTCILFDVHVEFISSNFSFDIYDEELYYVLNLIEPGIYIATKPHATQSFLN